MTPSELNRLRDKISETQRYWLMISQAIDIQDTAQRDVLLGHLAELAERQGRDAVESLRKSCGTRALRILSDSGLTRGSL